MSGFNLPANFHSDPETLLRKRRVCTVSSSATQSASESTVLAPTPPIAMAKTLRDYSTPVVANVPTGPAIIWGMEASIFTLGSSLWCRQANSVACQARMPTPIFRTSLSYATPSSSRTSRRTASGSVCLPFPSPERRNNGFIRTRKQLTHGKSAPRHSSPSSSP